MKLTDKQERFVQGLIKGLSQRQAYIDAGYSVNGKTDEYIDKKACELFSNGKVRGRYDEIHDRLIKESEDECIVDAKRVLKELANVGFSKATDFAKVVTTKSGLKSVELLDTDDIPEDKRSAIAGIKQGANGIEIKMNDKIKALELLGRHLGMFTDNLKLKSDENTEITITIGGEDYGD